MRDDAQERPGRPLLATLAEAQREQQVLLVLDNCEHLVAACANPADLLRACPTLTILAASRAALAVAEETTWRLPRLAPPENASAWATEQGLLAADPC